MLSFDTLKDQVADGTVDTVLVCLVDMQGRLMGKRFHAKHFVNGAWEETHCCNYLLATDLAMATPDGYASTSWERGYGDYVMKPDLSTLRPVPWLEGTVMVLCDVLDHHTHEEVSHSPRAILKKQVNRLKAMGYDAMCATELEFFLFARRALTRSASSGFRDLEPISGYNEDYNILQTTREEHVMRPIRNHLWDAGLPIENSKGEAETGQEELNIKYAAAMDTAEFHTIAKHAIKEIAEQQGHAVTFLPKWSHDKVGSSSHVHQSLWQDGKPAFFDESDELGMSALMKNYMAGLAEIRARLHRLHGALYQQLQALHEGHLCAHADHLVGGQPHRGLPAVRRRHQGHPGRMPHSGLRHEPLSGDGRHAGRRHCRASRKGWNCRRPPGAMSTRATPA